MTAPPFSPDEAQLRVLEHPAGPLLVTGGPGSGKTAVLCERFARLIEQGADPERVALVVGSTRARNEARGAMLERLASSLPDLRVLTIHGLAVHVMSQRYGELGYAEPPAVLSAADQFAKVEELLAGQDPARWPAYGHMLGLRGFADQVRQFLSRAQEELRTPEDIEARADARGLGGWHELAGFLREYQQVMDDLDVADFAAMIGRAARAAAGGDPLFDHLLVDDYQDSTLAAEALLEAIQAPDLVVAGDPAAHVFSFQGATDVPILRFTERFADAVHQPLEEWHRSPGGMPVAEAWLAAHTSEEHGAIARELRRLHVQEGVAWREMAVVVRRQGPHVGGLLRALDDARVPRAVPDSGLSLSAEPATFPYVLALKWLASEPDERAGLVESVLTSDLVRVSPAAARGLMRVALAADGTVAAALEHDDGLSTDEATELVTVREVLARAEAVAARSVLDAFRLLWRGLPCSRRLVGSADRSTKSRHDLDSVVAFASIVTEAGESADPSVQAFVEALESGDHGPGYRLSEQGRPDAVQVVTAHGAVGLEFDTLIMQGAVEGNFPSLSRPEPMFDLAALDRPITRSEANRARLEDERRLFRMVLGRARRRVVLMGSRSHADESSATSRFVEEIGVSWVPAPEGPFDEPVSVAEAAAAWRRKLANLDAPAARRLAALEGLASLGVDPQRWWFQREWSDTGAPLHEGIRASFSKLSTLENCELQYVLSAELGLGSPVGYQAWVGKTVHKIIEDTENGDLPRSLPDLVATVDDRWRPQEFPSTAVSEAWRRLAKERMLPNWFSRFGEHPAAAGERQFEFGFDGATINGVIDRVGPDPRGFGTRITDYKSGSADYAPKANESLQLGIYYLAVLEAEDLKEFQPINGVELAYLKGHWKEPHDIEMRTWEVGTDEREAKYQEKMRERLSENLAHLKLLNERERFRPNPNANCFFCEFRSLCSLWPQGAPLFPVDGSRSAPGKQGSASLFPVLETQAPS
ncbi:MAG: ATP-dependent helicase [Actinomycetota bacterium]|nr:ATP-dependent helicase [Actinomycetota bacterium]